MLRDGASLCIPSWLTRERESDLAVEYTILSCTGFVMEPGGLAGSGFFAFIHEGKYAFTYFITAAHTVWSGHRSNRQRAPAPDDPIYIRVNRLHGGLKEIKLKKSDWLYHEDRFVDLCAVPITDQEHRYLSEGDVSPIHIGFVAASCSNPGIQAEQVMLGDEVFITGAFLQRLGETKNIPIVRTGNIAALPEEPVEVFSPRQAAYLVETRSIGGISGSPVWIDPTANALSRPPRPQRSSQVIVPYRLVGMVLGTWHSETGIDFIPNETGHSDANWNMGISVVLPDFRIMEFLMSKPLEEHRRRAADERIRRSGAVFTSARSAPETRTDENPMAREHFTALVRAASKPKPKDDQT